MRRNQRSTPERDVEDTHQKALDVNLDPRRYGTFVRREVLYGIGWGRIGILRQVV